MVFNLTNTYAQQEAFPHETNSELEFYEFLKGIKYAEILADEGVGDLMQRSKFHADIYNAGLDFLKGMAFDQVGLSYWFDDYPRSSLCDKTSVFLNYDSHEKSVSNISLKFYSCNGDYWLFKSDKRFKLAYDLKYNIHTELLRLYGYKKFPYQKSSRIELMPIIKSGVDEDWIRNYLSTHRIDQNEGVYEQLIKGEDKSKNKVAVLDNDGYYLVIYLSGASNYEDWAEGEKKGYFDPTAKPNLYTVKWRKFNKNWDEDAIVTFKESYFEMYWPDIDHTDTYLKTFPLNTSVNSHSPSVSSGTGIGISSEGYILTNHHIISDASLIFVKGVNGDFSSRYKCDLILSDERNDLALLKITEGSVKMINPPFVFKRGSMDVGSEVFVLGYPLRSSMGDEIKLTNGIVSSRTGFQGDITTYQLTVPVQPGNSGGPLFSEEGELAGIISSKHVEAENASYAIKSSYFFNLLDALNSPPKLNTQNQLSTKSLVDQVKEIKNFIYIVEAEK